MTSAREPGTGGASSSGSRIPDPGSRNVFPGVAAAFVVMLAGFWLADLIGQQILAAQGLTGSSPVSGVPVTIVLGLLLREQLPLDAISAYSERIVGVALILVGGWGIWRASSTGFKPHAHTHTGASFAMGALHGLAGSSHLFGVLPALAFATRTESVLYLAGFGGGAVLAMSAFAAVMGLLTTKFSRRHSSSLLYASSAAALVIGGFWLVGQ